MVRTPSAPLLNFSGKEHNMGKLYQKLKNLNKIPMHMPGHKRNTHRFPQQKELFSLDITEIDGFDNLHSPCGILKESMDKAAKLFGSEHSIYLVNGSTCGILAGICALVNEGDKVVSDRACHKSVYNAIELSGAEPVFISPNTHESYGINTGITPEQIEEKLSQNSDCRLVVVTSPTYEGVILDVEGICRVAHSYNVPVLVDSAHGAHLGFGSFPKSAASLGADIVVQSLHKTLPSLTQTAICHVKHQYYNAIMDKLSVFETSSPSYLLMSSIDDCMDIIKEESLFSHWYNILTEFKKDTKSLKNLKILEKDNGFFDLDISKIVIFSSDAARLSDRLRDYNIEPEMTAPHYVLCMTGAGETKETLDALKDALFAIDDEFVAFEKKTLYPPLPKRAMSAKLAKLKKTEYIPLTSAKNRISAEYIWAYPPGVPIIIPGEIVDIDVLESFSLYEKNNIELSGSISHISGKILVINT